MKLKVFSQDSLYLFFFFSLIVVLRVPLLKTRFILVHGKRDFVSICRLTGVLFSLFIFSRRQSWEVELYSAASYSPIHWCPFS